MGGSSFYKISEICDNELENIPYYPLPINFQKYVAAFFLLRAFAL